MQTWETKKKKILLTYFAGKSMEDDCHSYEGHKKKKKKPSSYIESDPVFSDYQFLGRFTN